MPVIPGEQQQQVLQDRIPHPLQEVHGPAIDGTGQAFESLGGSIEKAGAVLNDVAARTQDAKQKLTAATALSQLQMFADQERAHALVDGAIPNDPYGDKQAAAFQQKMQDQMGLMGANLDPAAADLLNAHGSALVARDSNLVRAQAIKARTDEVAGLTQDFIATNGNLVKNNPAELTHQWTEAAQVITERTDLTEQEKANQIGQLHQNQLQSAYDGFIQRKQFGTAAKVLDDPQFSGTFDEKTVAQMQKKASDEDYQNSSRMYTNQQRTDMAAKKELEQQGKDAMTKFSVAEEAAGPNDTMRAAAIKTFLDPARDSGALSAQQYDARVNSKASYAQSDKEYLLGIAHDAVGGSVDYQAMKDKVQEDQTNGVVSAGGAYQAMVSLDNFQSKSKNGVAALLNQMQSKGTVEELVKSPEAPNGLSPAAQKQYNIQVKKANDQVTMQLFQQPDLQNPGDLIRQTMTNNVDEIKQAPQFSDTKEADHARDKLVEDFTRDKMSNKMTPALEMDYTNRMRAIDNGKKNLLLKKNSETK